ncbi:glutathione S-transferase family protein [Roseovarius sp. SK2]|uniref:glutathione S-transferase family protein n=1 Tax=Roseovarius TaxID=74030 RepID=UPI000CDCFD6F|nr:MULTISPECIES: glutathione S-transferase family protein [Roseovarius]MDD9725558.1 glutathione S-transferase family protein [Roseovarius sp. SK2]
MYTLFWEYMAGSIVVQATLEAMNADYRMEYVDMSAGQHLEPEFLARNPAGRVPALQLPDGGIMGETSAIVTHLGEMAPTSGLTPRPGDPDRGDFLFWLSVMSTAGYITSGRVGHPERYARDRDAIRQVKAQGDKDYAAFFDLMENHIAGAPYFLPRGLTVLDFYLAMLAEWISDRDKALSQRPALARLCSTVRETPSYATALAAHAMPEPVLQA